MKGHSVGYIRVSSVDQNTTRQLDQIPLDKVFTDKASGKDTHRPQLEACLAHLRDGDTLHVHSMCRLSRNLDDLRKVVNELTSRGVIVRFHKESLTFTGQDSPMSNLLLSLLGAVAEFERSLIRERQKEGVEIARKAGKYLGRKPALSPDRAKELVSRAAAGEKKTSLAREFGISRETVYTYLASSSTFGITVSSEAEHQPTGG